MHPWVYDGISCASLGLCQYPRPLKPVMAQVERLHAGDLGLVCRIAGLGGSPRGLWKGDELRGGWGHPEDVMVYTISGLFPI